MLVCDRRLVLGCIVLTALLVHFATWSMLGCYHPLLPQMHPIPPPLSQSPVSIKPAYSPAGMALAPPLRPTHVLPRNVPCTEFSDLDAAHARCENESSELAIHCPRASGMEAACVSSAAAVETDCARVAAARAAGTPANSSLDWSAVAFAMATYDAEFERQMLQVGAETWMRMTVGADLVLGIDLDDPRKQEEIRPSWGHTEPPLQVSVSKADSPCQRTPPSEGFVREGWKARSKVIYTLLHMGRLFHPSSYRSGAPKRYFLKVDADATLFPHHLLRFLRRFEEVVGSGEAAMFGMAACRPKKHREPTLCHAGGGAAYGLTLPAINALQSYVDRAYPDFLKEADNVTYGGEDAVIAFALKRAAGISVVHCGAFHQHRPDQYYMSSMDQVYWPSSATPISFHHFRSPFTMKSLFKCAMYDLRSEIHMKSFKCPPYNEKLLCNTSAIAEAAYHARSKHDMKARSWAVMLQQKHAQAHSAENKSKAIAKARAQYRSKFLRSKKRRD